MIILGRRSSFLLFAGDIAAFAVSLFLTLWLRYGEFPSLKILAPYLVPFALLFLLWALVFYMAGLYGKQLALSRAACPTRSCGRSWLTLFSPHFSSFSLQHLALRRKDLVLYLAVSLRDFMSGGSHSIQTSLTSDALSCALLAEGSEADELVRGER